MERGDLQAMTVRHTSGEALQCEQLRISGAASVPHMLGKAATKHRLQCVTKYLPRRDVPCATRLDGTVWLSQLRTSCALQSAADALLFEIASHT